MFAAMNRTKNSSHQRYKPDLSRKLKKRRKPNMFSYLTASKSKKPRWDYSDLRSATEERRKGKQIFQPN